MSSFIFQLYVRKYRMSRNMSQEQTWPRLRNGKNELCGSESPLRRQETQKFCEVGAAVAEGKSGSLNVLVY